MLDSPLPSCVFAHPSFGITPKTTTTFSTMLRIRLQRFGTKNEPTCRLVVAEQAIRRDGRFVEVLGNYNPRARGKTPGLVINVERVDHWVKLGAQPSDTAKSLVKRAREEAAAPAKA